MYTVQDEAGKGQARTLHRNKLLPIGALDCDTVMEKSIGRSAGKMGRVEQKKRKKEDFESEEGIIPMEITISRGAGLRPNAPVFFPAREQEQSQRESLSLEEDAQEQSERESLNLEEDAGSTSESDEGSESEEVNEEEANVQVPPTPHPRRTRTQATR